MNISKSILSPLLVFISDWLLQSDYPSGVDTEFSNRGYAGEEE